MRFPLALIFAMSLTTAPLVAGTLTGDTVNVTHYFNGDPQNFGDQTVPGATFIYPGDFYTLLVGGDTITLNMYCPYSSCGNWSGGAFNGPLITDLSNAPITSVTLSAATTYPGYDASRIRFDASHIRIDLNLLNIQTRVIQLDLNGTAAVPEPGTGFPTGVATIAIGLVVARRQIARV